MKMGTIRSPCPYDAAARHALQPVNLRRPAILYYASWDSLLSIIFLSYGHQDRADASRGVRICHTSGSSPGPRETEVGMFLRLRLRTTGATLSMVDYGGSASRAVKVRVREVRLIPRTRVGRTDQGLNKR